MAFNGSGTYVRSFTWATDKANSVAVTASRVDTEDDGFATGLSTCICKDGQTTTTARIPFSLGIGIGTGTVALPAINITSDTNTGIYSAAVGEFDIACGGTRILKLSSAGANVTGVVTATGNISTSGGSLSVAASGAIGSSLTVGTTLGVTGTATFSGAATVGANFSVTGTSTLAGTLNYTGHGTTASAANAFIDAATGLVARSTSSARYKDRVENISTDEARQIISRLRPIKFHSTAKNDDPDQQHFGLIAEEVAEVDPRLVFLDADGKPGGVQYDRLLIPVIKILQEARI